MRRLSIVTLTLILACTLALGGCFGIPDPPDRLAQAKSWIGQPVDKLVLAWGPPKNTYTLSDETRILEFETYRWYRRGGRTIHMPTTNYQRGIVYGSNGPVGFYSGSSQGSYPIHIPVRETHLTCTIRFRTTIRGASIWGVTAEGNDCQPD